MSFTLVRRILTFATALLAIGCAGIPDPRVTDDDNGALPFPLANLTVGNYQVSFAPGRQALIVRLGAINNGNVSSPEFTVRADLVAGPGSPVPTTTMTTTFDGLAVGENSGRLPVNIRQLVVPHAYPYLAATLDPSNLVPELDETDNVRRFDLTCQSWIDLFEAPSPLTLSVSNTMYSRPPNEISLFDFQNPSIGGMTGIDTGRFSISNSIGPSCGRVDSVSFSVNPMGRFSFNAAQSSTVPLDVWPGTIAHFEVTYAGPITGSIGLDIATVAILFEDGTVNTVNVRGFHR